MSGHEVDRDVLLGRVIEGRASATDWRTLREIASHEPQVWAEIEELESMNTALRLSCNDAAACAECVDIDAESSGRMVEHASVRLGAARMWGGWLAAAAVLLAWSLGMPLAGDEHSAQGAFGANFVKIDTPDDALRMYVDRGREAGTVIGLVPETHVLETRTLPDGTGIEVIFVRQIVERQQLREMYRMIEDEAGNLVPIPTPLVRQAGMSF